MLSRVIFYSGRVELVKIVTRVDLESEPMMIFITAYVVPDVLVPLEAEVCELTYAFYSSVDQSSKTHSLARNETKWVQ